MVETEGVHIHGEECFRVEDAQDEPESAEETAAPAAEGDAEWQQLAINAGINGEWAHDVVALARSQVGYAESTRDFVEDANGVRQGYTRYGAWAQKPYADWNAAFAAFCYSYAYVPSSALRRSTSVSSLSAKLQ